MNQTFGFLAGIAVIVALACDLIVLPATIRMVESVRGEALLRNKRDRR